MYHISPQRPDHVTSKSISAVPTISLSHSTDTSYRYIRVLHPRNQIMTARETASNVPGPRRISTQTVRNHLRENDIRARSPYFGAGLRRRHRLARIRWCNRVRSWDLLSWRRVWFSEESRFMLQKRDGGARFYKRWNDRLARNCVLEVVNVGEGSVMMWGAISYAAKFNWCISAATLALLDTEMRF